MFPNLLECGEPLWDEKGKIVHMTHSGAPKIRDGGDDMLVPEKASFLSETDLKRGLCKCIKTSFQHLKSG